MKFFFLAIIWMAFLPAQAKLRVEPVCRSEVNKLLPVKMQERFWWKKDLALDKANLPGWHHLNFKTKTAYDYASKNDKAFVTIAARGEKTGKLYELSEPKCQLKTSPYTVPSSRLPSQENPFTDADLVNLVDSHPWGVVYVWTAGMPLSIRAIAEIKKAVQAKGGFLTVLYDPYSRSRDLLALAKQHGLTETELRRMNSDELMARGFGLHYPSAILYSNGALSSRIYMGHKKAEVYERWIDIELARLSKEGAQ